MDSSKYRLFKGDIFAANIINVINSTSFYIVKEECKVDILKIQDVLLKNELTKMFWIPEVLSEKFLLELDLNLYRAMRIKNQNGLDEDKYLQVYLLDTGETFAIEMNDITDDGFYVMPEEMNSIPPLAVLVKWKPRNIDVKDFDESTYLKNNIYRAHTVEVLKVRPEVLVDIWPQDENGGCDFPKEDDDENSDETSFDENNENSSSDIESVENFDEDAGIGRKTLTKKQIDDLFEEPLDTESALIAVQGFESKDEEHLCKFYNPKTGGCFKGSNCKKVHLPSLSDGYECRDKEELFFKNLIETSTIPPLYKYFEIKILSFITLKRFVCRIIKNGNEDANRLRHMNDENETKNFQKLKSYPVIHQLVIIKMNERFFRAQIVNACENEDMFFALFLDEGFVKKVHCNMIYNWSLRFHDVEFQTVEMEIAHIHPNNENMKEAIAKIFEIQAKCARPIRAYLVENLETLRCKLFDSNGNDILEILVNNRLAAYNDFYNESQLIPKFNNFRL